MNVTIKREGIELPSALTVAELGEKLGVSPINVIKTLMRNGIMATMNQVLDFDTAAIVAADLNKDVYEEGSTIAVPIVEEVEAEQSFEGFEPEPEVDEELVVEEPLDLVEEEVVRTPRRPAKTGRRTRPGRTAEDGTEDGASSESLVEDEADVEPPDPPESLEKRPPVVTVMGHVDHGKTMLLDTIRSANVIAGEAGGITQHIGAYQVEKDGHKITFLDTPGHAAFTAMRARGAKVTDIAVIVIAANEGIMPQTVEAIDHAKAAEVPILIAVNKIDLPDANIDRVKAGLAEIGINLIEWGGDTELAPISAKTGEGIDHLLETIILTSEVANDAQGLQANPNRSASGTVIEARMDRQRGPLATVIVQRGTLEVGQFVAAGAVVGKARALISDNGEIIKSAGPSTPVTILGMSEVPNAGDLFRVYSNEREARASAEKRSELLRLGALGRPARTGAAVADLFAQMQRAQGQELKLVLKADVQGSVEAILGALQSISDDAVEEDPSAIPVRVLHSSVGPVTESDVLLAAASGAMVVGFGVGPDPAARRVIKGQDIEFREYSVIYKLTEDIEALIAGHKEPVYVEVVYGHAEVRQIFTAGRTTIAGGYVTDGRIPRNSSIRIVRQGDIVWSGAVGSLKRFKDDVREVQTGYEFGLTLDGFNAIEESDIIEAFGQERAA